MLGKGVIVKGWHAWGEQGTVHLQGVMLPHTPPAGKKR